MYQIAVRRRHRFERLGTAGLDHLGRQVPREALEGFPALRSVPRHIHMDPRAMAVSLTLDDRAYQLLDGCERDAARPDEQTEILSRHLDQDRFILDHARDIRSNLERVHQPLGERFRGFGLLLDRHIMLRGFHVIPLFLARTTRARRCSTTSHRLAASAASAPTSTRGRSGRALAVTRRCAPITVAPITVLIGLPRRLLRTRPRTSAPAAATALPLAGLLSRDRLHSGTDSRLTAAQPTEEPGSRLFHHLVFDVFVVNSELVERGVQRLRDGAPSRLHPLHRVRLRLLDGTISPSSCSCVAGSAQRRFFRLLFRRRCPPAELPFPGVEPVLPTGRPPLGAGRCLAPFPPPFPAVRSPVAPFPEGGSWNNFRNPPGAFGVSIACSVLSTSITMVAPADSSAARPGMVIFSTISSCWPNRQLLLTRKYSTSPAGNWREKSPNMIGR